MDNIVVFTLVVILTIVIQVMTTFVRNKKINFIIFVSCVAGIGCFPLYFHHSKDNDVIFQFEIVIFFFFSVVYAAILSIKQSQGCMR
jgi:hypothetical protein